MPVAPEPIGITPPRPQPRRDGAVTHGVRDFLPHTAVGEDERRRLERRRVRFTLHQPHFAGGDARVRLPGEPTRIYAVSERHRNRRRFRPEPVARVIDERGGAKRRNRRRRGYRRGDEGQGRSAFTSGVSRERVLK